MNSKLIGTAVVILLYAIATYTGIYVLQNYPTGNTLIDLLQADIAATVVVFVGSIVTRNASMYDAYWSVAPIAFVFFWLFQADEVSVRAMIVAGLVAYWGVRLTYNWYRGWPNLKHEDWRYADLKAKTKFFYPFVNLTGIHLMPTLMVFAGALPLQYALTANTPLNLYDIIAILITVIALYFETVADEQLLKFRNNPDRKKGEILSTGLWSLSRHPNYFGETFFWIGLFVFGLAADGPVWPMVLGPISMLGLFLGISIPMIDKRMLASKPGYEERMKTTPAFFPWYKKVI
jgi:steroid 5-alpha reductase family enzyme